MDSITRMKNIYNIKVSLNCKTKVPVSVFLITLFPFSRYITYDLNDCN